LLAVGIPVFWTVALLLQFSTGVVYSVRPGLTVHAAARGASATGQDADRANASIMVDYPQDASIFPPDIVAPTFLWRDTEPSAHSWRVDVIFADHAKPLRTISTGEGMKIGEIDPRCVSTANKLPFLTPEQAAAHTWKPEPDVWALIKKHSIAGPATVEFTGLNEPGRPVSHGRVTLKTSADPVGAPIFYRDVPLMPFEGDNHVVQPLAPAKMSLIAWRLRDIGKPESRLLVTGLHTCANCHSFSTDGKTMGIDVDGPANDKGLYAVVPVKQHIVIRNEDTVSWNQDMQVGKSRVGFMSQVSPDGKYVLTTFAGRDQSIGSSYFVTNFKDYRFLQVFYPTRGILTWYSRETGRRQPLPGADDPRYVQTDGVWSPDGKYIVFVRAEAKEPHPEGLPLPTEANDPNEVQIQYSLYRVPFNDGKGGVAEPILGASNNGMSNNFPKISPDGSWIVFVKCRNAQLMRPDSELYIVPATGGVARRMRANTSLMNSWHSFSPNGRWLVFSSKSRSPYTQMYLTHIDADGNDSPPILIDNSTPANRAVNLPEFVNISQDGMLDITSPASDFYRMMDDASDLQAKGDTTAAIDAWQKALGVDPNDARANFGLGGALSAAGKSSQAIPYFRQATEINPDFLEAFYGLGVAQMREQNADEAIVAFKAAVQISPQFFQAHESLGFAYYVQGKYSDALVHLRLALDGEPDRVSVLVLAASLMATSADAAVRNGPEAVLLAERALDLTQGNDTSVLDTLSAAYAESGHFDQAIHAEDQAIALAEKQGDADLVAKLKAHRAKYEAGKPLRDPEDQGTV
jgi:Tol biopolymer transport system component/Flp pilus assembly protein TadD